MPFSYHYQMEIHLGLLPYSKENDTSEEVSLYCYHFNTLLLIKVEKKKICLHILIALSNWIWKIYHIDIILRSKLYQFVQFEISPSMSHKVFIFLKITHMYVVYSMFLMLKHWFCWKYQYNKYMFYFIDHLHFYSCEWLCR